MRSPLITLTTDYGLTDPYVGILKSRILQRAPAIPLIDLTHAIRRFHPEDAGYWLYCCHSQLPAGTVHVAVVDPGVGSERSILVMRAGGQLFVAPDNGLLGLIAQSAAAVVSFRVDADALNSLGLAAESATFHGRDLLGPLGAELAMGRAIPEELGRSHAPLLGNLHPPSVLPDGSLLGAVAAVDHFGNLLTTVAARDMGARQSVRLAPGAAPLPRVRTYAQAPAGQCVALINSAAMLEIAARQASAAEALSATVGQAVYVAER